MYNIAGAKLAVHHGWRMVYQAQNRADNYCHLECSLYHLRAFGEGEKCVIRLQIFCLLKGLASMRKTAAKANSKHVIAIVQACILWLNKQKPRKRKKYPHRALEGYDPPIIIS